MERSTHDKVSTKMKTAMNEGIIQTTGISSWYDGFLYSSIMSQLTKPLAKSVAKLIREHSVVLDIGCGAGQLAFMLSGKCKQVTGIDFSKRMVKDASKQKTKRNLVNVDFIYGDGARVSEIFSQRFNYITAMMCLHEMDYQSRHQVITGCLKLTDQVILADYVAPLPRNILGWILNLIELGAGKRHYAHFKDWQKRGGINGFIKQEDLNVAMRKPWQYNIVETVIISGRNQ